MQDKRPILILLFLAFTPLVILRGVSDSFNLPKLVWIFLGTSLFFFERIRRERTCLHSSFIIPAGLLLLWQIITLHRCINPFAGINSIITFLLLITAISASILAISVNALASFPFNNAATYFLFWRNLAFLGAMSGKEKTGYHIQRPILRLYFAVFLFTGLILSCKAIGASRYLFKAKKSAGVNATELSEKVLRFNPFSFEGIFAAAKIALYEEDYEKAYTLLLRAKNLNPFSYSLYNNLGLVYFKTGNYRLAEKSYLSSIQLAPHKAETYNNIASVYIESGQYDEAIAFLEKAVTIKSNLYFAFFNLGLAHYLKEEFSEAEKYFTRTLELNPNFISAKTYLQKITDD